MKSFFCKKIYNDGGRNGYTKARLLLGLNTAVLRQEPVSYITQSWIAFHRLQTGYKTQTENCFFVRFFSSDIWYLICHPVRKWQIYWQFLYHCQHFSQFFVNEDRNADKHISQGNCCPSSFLNGNFPKSMFLSPITSLEVEYYISQMDNNKSIGPCSIPVPLLKILKTQIFPLLLSLNNDYFLCGIFPNKLRLSKLLQFSWKTRQR